jgi:hypothetical protein
VIFVFQETQERKFIFSGTESFVDASYKSLPPKLRAMAKEKNTKQVNVKKEPTKSLKEKRAAKQEKREDKLKNRG